MTDAGRPFHLVVLAGLSTGAYALALAAMAALQSSADQALIEDRAPAVAVVGRAAAAHDELAATVDAASRRYRSRAARYDALGGSIDAYESTLDELVARTDAITESVGSLPTRIQLPSAPSIPAAAPRTQPATDASTGASG
jgi:hypothetical protein